MSRPIREIVGDPDVLAGLPQTEKPEGYSDAKGPFDLQARLDCATALAQAIADAHPDDACQLMTAALIDLSAGLPEGAAFVSVREDAIWWASIATPIELLEVMTAALKQLGRRALHLEMRKRLFMTLWRSFTKDDQARFVDFARRVSP